jgi:hypothetical protein
MINGKHLGYEHVTFENFSVLKFVPSLFKQAPVVLKNVFDSLKKIAHNDSLLKYKTFEMNVSAPI